MTRPKPVVLLILDGWGVAPKGEGNAIARAKLPNLDGYAKKYPVMTLTASGNEVGLSWGEMGNSEVGHLNIGAGRVYYQTLPRINKEIASGEFFKNPAFLRAAEHVKKHKSRLHLVGLVSVGNVHAAQDHLFALLEFARKQKIREVFVHAILDGRDAHYASGKGFIEQTIAKMKKLGIGKIASLSGRFYAMDRDNRWDRAEKAYGAMTRQTAEDSPLESQRTVLPLSAEDPLRAIEASYDKKIYDEEFAPTVITEEGKAVGPVADGDAVIFFNFRPDRARELTKAFVLPSFSKFARERIKNLLFVTMAEYEKDLPAIVAYPPETIKHCLAEVVSKAKLTQCHIAETEKYAHLTFFLNGTVEAPFPGEAREIIPSPKVSSYDKAPEMSAPKIAERAVRAIEGGKYDFIAVNFANGDMVAHTGKITATIKGVETVDRAIGRIVDTALARGGVALITADHGNAEELLNVQTGEPDKEHSTNPVPCHIIGKAFEGKTAEIPNNDLSTLPPAGVLADVAPTILKIMGIKQPNEMTGRPLV